MAKVHSEDSSNRPRRDLDQVNPRTPAQWQEAADMADFLLTLESARAYGLVEGGPVVNVERCEDILRMARCRGTTPRPGALEQLVAAFANPQ